MCVWLQQRATVLSSYPSLVEKDVSCLLPPLTHCGTSCLGDLDIIIVEPAVTWGIQLIVWVEPITDVVS